MYFDAFKEFLSFEKKYSLHTIKAYLTDIKAFEAFILEENPSENIVNIGYKSIRRWIVFLSDKGLDNRSINRKMSSLKAYYSFLQQTLHLKESPFLQHTPLKQEKKLFVAFSDKEIDHSLQEISAKTPFETLRNKAIIELFYATGIRRSELLNIKTQDIDFERKTIKILGKRNKERIIPLIDSAVLAIKDYLEERNFIQNKEQENFLFLTSKGYQIYPELLYRLVKNSFTPVTTKQKKSPHILRHSFATNLLSEGAELNSIKELLGHSSLASTQVYIHSGLAEIKKQYKKAHPRAKDKV